MIKLEAFIGSLLLMGVGKKRLFEENYIDQLTRIFLILLLDYEQLCQGPRTKLFYRLKKKKCINL